MSEPKERAMIIECGGARMVGVLHLPEGQSEEVAVVIVVGGPQYRVGSHRQFTLMARSLANAGYPVLRFDYRGMGDSDGPSRTFDQVDDDIAAAVDATLQSSGVTSVVLWGLCDAASACMIYGNRGDPRVCGVIAANPWVRTAAGEAQAYVRHYYLRRFFSPAFWRKVVGGQFQGLSSLRDLLRKLSAARRSVSQSAPSFIERMLRGVSVDLPMLLLLSERDLTAREFVDHCATSPAWSAVLQRADVRRVELPGADHTFSARRSLEAATGACRLWLATLKSAPQRTAAPAAIRK